MGKRKSLRTISELPEGIMHQILSLLEPKDAVMASLMSKTWLGAWLTKPNLLIRYDDFKGENRVINARTLLRYQQQNIGIDSLEIVIDDDNDMHIDYVDESYTNWLKVAVANGVKSIKFFPSLEPPYSFGFHGNVVSQAESLVDLQVRCCGFFWVDNWFYGVEMSQKTMCHKLKNLWLSTCKFDELVFEEILSSCKSIENLYVGECEGFNQLKVANPPKLKRLELFSNEVCHVEVESSSLEYFYWKETTFGRPYLVFGNNEDMMSKLTLNACPNLKCLHLQCILIIDGFFSNFACKFPQLEDLEIDSSLVPQRIRISSNSVKKMNLAENLGLEEVEINVPSLDCFKFKGKIVPQFNFVAVSSVCIYEIKKKK